MNEVLDDVFRKTLEGFGEELAAFGPNLLAMLVILGVGVVLAKALRLSVRFVLPRVGFDRFAERSGLTLVLQKGGITRPASMAVASILSWTFMGVFVLLAIGALNLRIAMELLSQAFAYLPQLLIAGALVVLGSALAAFVKRSVLIAAVNAGLPSARFLAGGAHTAVLIVFVAMGLEHLGVGRQILVVSFTILFGGVVLALALAFGYAGQGLAREVLDRLAHGPAPREPADDLSHL
jgi:mechanosensitive ion channel-like protein